MTASERLTTAWPILAAAVSLAMLATAHAFERFGGYAPCGLCLKQRDVYWAALTIALIGYALMRAKRLAPEVLALLLAAAFATGAVVAAYHAGVEWKWWPGPTSCTGGAGLAVSGDLSDLLSGKRVRPPACDEAAWRMLGLSMAGYNALISLGLTILGFAVALAPKARRQ